METRPCAVVEHLSWVRMRVAFPERAVPPGFYHVRMEIPPDGKDWTWVVERACPDCGFDPGAQTYDELPAVMRERSTVWPEVLARPDAAQRPGARTWSPLEYAAHLRDVCAVFRGRLESMLDRDDPLFENWDQDAAAVAGRYGEQDPGVVATELAVAAEAAAAAFAAVPPQTRGRTGRRGDGARFTVETLARYFAHEHVHHVWDVRYR